MLRADRAEQLTAAIAAELAEIPDQAVLEALPAGIRPAVVLLRKLARVDLIAEVRRSAASSAARLPGLIREDPARAQAIADRVIWLAAWLDDQTDDQPELTLFRSS